MDYGTVPLEEVRGLFHADERWGVLTFGISMVGFGFRRPIF
jgi:hypothetical protein